MVTVVNKKIGSLVGILMLVSVGPIALANVGLVDMQKAIQSTAAGKKAKETLDAEFQKRKTQLDKKKADIEKMGQDLEKKRTVLSEEVFGKKNVEFQEEMMKFQKVVGENQLEIQKKEKELIEPIVEKMKKAITKVSEEKKLDIVFEKSANNILYAKKEVDITDDVNKAYEKEK